MSRDSLASSSVLARRVPAPQFGANWRLSILVISALGALLPAGCTRQDLPSGGSLDSRIFSRAEIIGTRGTGAGEFNKPRSLTVDKEDNLYAVDMTGRVQKFSPQGRFLLSWQMPQTDLGKPKGMCHDTSGNVVVVEPHYQRINHFSPEGKLVAQWGRSGTNAGELAMPRAVAAGANGVIFVSEYGLVDRVQGFSPPDWRLRTGFGAAGPGKGQFARPEGLGIDGDNRIHVADSCNHRVQVFSPDGQWLETYGQPGTGVGELSYPYDVKIDADGRRFVCEFGNSRIQVFDAQGRPLERLGGAGQAPGKFDNPWSIALDSQGNLYVADAGNHRVQKLVRRPEAGGKSVAVTAAQRQLDPGQAGRSADIDRRP